MATAEQRHRDREIEMARQDPRLRGAILSGALRRAGELGIELDAAALLRMQAALAPRSPRPRDQRRRKAQPYAALLDAIQRD